MILTFVNSMDEAVGGVDFDLLGSLSFMFFSTESNSFNIGDLCHSMVQYGFAMCSDF